MAKAKPQEEYNVLNVEIELISDTADVFIEAARQRSIGEDELIADLLQALAINKGMIDAILDGE